MELAYNVGGHVYRLLRQAMYDRRSIVAISFDISLKFHNDDTVQYRAYQNLPWERNIQYQTLLGEKLLAEYDIHELIMLLALWGYDTKNLTPVGSFHGSQTEELLSVIGWSVSKLPIYPNADTAVCSWVQSCQQNPQKLKALLQRDYDAIALECTNVWFESTNQSLLPRLGIMLLLWYSRILGIGPLYIAFAKGVFESSLK